MANFKKIEYYDLRAEAVNKKLPDIIGRQNEMERMARVVSRRIHNNVCIIGPSGVGKTSLMYGWVNKMVKSSDLASLGLVQFDVEHLYHFDASSEQTEFFKGKFGKVGFLNFQVESANIF